jgi:hypothetical protein
MKAVQERTDANRREKKAEIKPIIGVSGPSRIYCLPESPLKKKMKDKMDSHHKKLMAIMKAGQYKREIMMKACLNRQRPRIWR